MSFWNRWSTLYGILQFAPSIMLFMASNGCPILTAADGSWFSISRGRHKMNSIDCSTPATKLPRSTATLVCIPVERVTGRWRPARPLQSLPSARRQPWATAPPSSTSVSLGTCLSLLLNGSPGSRTLMSAHSRSRQKLRLM